MVFLTVHIDMSGKFQKKTTVGVALITSDKKDHCGLALSKQLINKITREFSYEDLFPKLYAICVFCLIKKKISKVEKIILCNDEPFLEVKKSLLKLINSKINIISITEHRYEKKDMYLQKYLLPNIFYIH
jgi:hypothetical protein